MKIAIVGGGFTGLSAALRLSQKKHQVFLFEKEEFPGGLAATFKLPHWSWSIERHYHHFFSNDFAAIKLINNLGLAKKLIFPRTLTSLFYQGKIYPFNTPLQILQFTPLSFFNRLRLGGVTLFFKLLPLSFGLSFEKETAFLGIKKYFGEKTAEVVWEPLLKGKFHQYAEKVNFSWFWARIKKRTLKLGYLEGGFETLIKSLLSSLEKNGVKIYLKTPFLPKKNLSFDKILVTTSSPIFVKMYPYLPFYYQKKLLSTPYLHALNLLLITKEKFLKKTYWLNINEKNFPFIAIIQQTNMIESKYYGGNHLTWIANYLPKNHPYLKKDKKALFTLYLPYLKKINPNFNFESSILDYQLFFGPFAQPVFLPNHSKTKPEFITPLPNVYLANMEMVYPWDRGINYAIELGENVAEFIHQRS